MRTFSTRYWIQTMPRASPAASGGVHNQFGWGLVLDGEVRCGTADLPRALCEGICGEQGTSCDCGKGEPAHRNDAEILESRTHS